MDRPWTNKSWLEVRVKNNIKAEDIAKEAGCSLACISKWVKRFDLKFDKLNKLRKTGEWDNKDWLTHQHWTLEKSIRSIAKEINLSSPRLLARFNYYHIPIRSNIEATRLNAPIISEITKQNWQNPQHKDTWMKARCKLWANPEYKEKHSIIMSAKWEDPKYRQKMTLQSSHLHQNPDYVKKKLNSLRGCNKSTLEDIFEYYLNEIGMKYTRNKLVGQGSSMREFDFELEDGRLIEIDGTFPHLQNHVIANDAFKNKLCKQLKKTLIRVPEEQFWSINLFEALNSIIGYNINPILLEKSELKLETLTVKECNQFFKLYHYLHNCGRYGRAIALKDGEHIICAAIFSSPIRKESATSLGLDHSKVKEIARFAISPKYDIKNLGSWFLSRAMKSYKDDKIKAIIAFADPAVGHTGALYKSLNMKLYKTSNMDYWYEDKDGVTIHKKTLWNRMKSYNKKNKTDLTEVEYAIAVGTVRVYYPGKLKFVKYL